MDTVVIGDNYQQRGLISDYLRQFPWVAWLVSPVRQDGSSKRFRRLGGNLSFFYRRARWLRMAEEARQRDGGLAQSKGKGRSAGKWPSLDPTKRRQLAWCMQVPGVSLEAH